MRIFGIILATVGAAIMAFGFLSASTVAKDPVKEFIWSLSARGLHRGRSPPASCRRFSASPACRMDRCPLRGP